MSRRVTGILIISACTFFVSMETGQACPDGHYSGPLGACVPNIGELENRAKQAVEGAADTAKTIVTRPTEVVPGPIEVVPGAISVVPGPRVVVPKTITREVEPYLPPPPRADQYDNKVGIPLGAWTAARCLENLGACPERVRSTMPDWQVAERCAQYPANCPRTVLLSLPASAVRPVLDEYLGQLEQQADGRWKLLPESFIADFAGEYPTIALQNVRYAMDINTVHGKAITVGNKIYFPTSIDLKNRDDRKWMLHELQHVVQYSRSGTKASFLGEYIASSAVEIVQTRSVDVHDNLGHELEAERVATRIADAFGDIVRVNNACDKQIRLLVRTEDPNGDWRTRGWWTVDPGNKTVLLTEGRSVHTRNPNIFYYAEANGVAWRGTAMTVDYGGAQYGLRAFTLQQANGRLELRLTCS